MAGRTWEQCVREVTLSADPETVGSVGVGWKNLSTELGYLRDALVGRSFVGPIAPGTERPHTGGLPGMLAGWKGSGGDAYREHLDDIGKGIEELITNASDVSGALSRIEGDIRKSVASIPIPLMDDFGWNEWSLPNGTELDDARDGESASGFLAALRKDYQSNPASYADGAFRDKADDLEATMKIDGQANDHKRGGWWDTSSHLNNWYRDNQQAANSGMSPLPKAVETERPKLVVPAPEGGENIDGYRPRTQTPPSGYTPGSGGMDGGTGFGGGIPSLGSTGIGGGGSYSGDHSSVAPPSTAGSFGSGHTGGAGSYTPSAGAGYPGTGDHDYGSGLAGAGGPSTIGGGYNGPTGGGGGLNGLGGGGFGSGSPGLGTAGGVGGAGLGAAGGIGVGGIPGMVGGGNGKVPPMTSAAKALRNAAGASGAAGLRGGAGGMMGGGMMGGRGGAGHGGDGAEHSSWLTEDDDPWGTGDAASPGILR